MRILVVEDDTPLRRTLTIGLTAENHTVLAAADGRTAVQACREDRPELMILDLGLPDISGITVLRTIRPWTRLPVIVLSARSDSSDKVEALDAGADDYITKPFLTEELLARIRAAARRADVRPPSIDVGELHIDTASREVTRGGRAIALTPTEWALLEVLLRNAGRLVASGTLLNEVWGPGYARQTNYLRTHFAALRKKLEADPAQPRHILNEPGAGYRFVPGT